MILFVGVNIFCKVCSRWMTMLTLTMAVKASLSVVNRLVIVLVVILIIVWAVSPLIFTIKTYNATVERKYHIICWMTMIRFSYLYNLHKKYKICLIKHVVHNKCVWCKILCCTNYRNCVAFCMMRWQLVCFTWQMITLVCSRYKYVSSALQKSTLTCLSRFLMSFGVSQSHSKIYAKISCARLATHEVIKVVDFFCSVI